VNESSTVISSFASLIVRPAGTVNVVRKKRSPRVTLLLASPSAANHIHEAPWKSTNGADASGGAPIQRAVQSDVFSRPVSNQAGSLHGVAPWWPQALTRQK
jgi:hypothetical protein